MNIKRFIVAAILIIAVSSLALVWYFSSSAQTHIEDIVSGQFGDSNLKLATEVARAIEKEIDSVGDKMAVMTRVPEVRYGGTKECSDKLKEMYADMRDQPGNIGRVDSHGVFYCGVIDSIVGVDATKYPYIRNILSDPEHKPVLSRAIMFEYVDHTRYLTALHVPVFDQNDNFTGTLGGAIFFDEIYDRYIKDIAGEGITSLYLIDDNGDILYHRNADFVSRNQNDDYMQEILQASPGWPEIARRSQEGQFGIANYTYDGQAYLATYAPVNVFPGRHWSVVVSVPVFEIQGFLAPLIADLRYEVLAILVVLALFTMGLLFYSQRENKLLEEKHKFIATISHQLRTPVTAIRWNLEGVLGGATSLQGECLNLIYQKVLNINSIVNNLIYLLEGTFKFRPSEGAKFDLSRLTQDTLAKMDNKIKQRQVSVNFEGAGSEYMVFADEHAIGRTLHYLLDNAVDYNRVGGSIKIKISEDARDVKVSIGDSGIGIPESEQAGVFKDFFRASNASLGKSEGSGVSLYLAKMIVTAHKGRIGFHSVEDVGSTFWFTIRKA